MILQSLAPSSIRLIKEFLNDLRIQHADDVGERRVIIGNDRKDRSFLISDPSNLHIIMVRDMLDLLEVESGQAHGKGYIDTFRRFASTLLVNTVLLYGNMIRIIRRQLVEQQIECGNVGFFLLANIRV